MKIALIRQRYTPYGGAERYVAALARGLLQRGHEVHIYAREWKEEDGVRVHRVPVLKAPGFVQILWFAHLTCRMIQGQDYDIVHSFERTFCQDIYRAGDGCHREWLLARRQGDPLVKRWTYGLNPLHRAILGVEKRLYRDPRLKLVVVNSRRVKEEIVRHYRFPPERIRVIYNGVRESLLEPQRSGEVPRPPGLKPGEKMVLFLGSGFERKNLATAIEALSLIAQASVRLWVVGRDRTAPYRRLARKLGVEDRVVFAGPQRNPLPFYCHAQAFVLPTIYEPFSNACLEASALGLPVVTTRRNGFSELLVEGRNGFVVEDPWNARELAEKIQAALEMGKLPPPSYPTVGDNVREMLDLYEALGRGDFG